MLREQAGREMRQEIRAAVRAINVIADLAESDELNDIMRITGNITNLFTVLGMAQRRAGELYGLRAADEVYKS